MIDKIAYFEAKLQHEIDAWDLHEMLKASENVVVIDARSYEAYLREHIPEAINIPHKRMNVENTGSLDKSALYITYCDGIGCNASTKGALNMAKLGFNVKELIGGIDWWKRDGYKTTLKHDEENKSVCGC